MGFDYDDEYDDFFEREAYDTPPKPEVNNGLGRYCEDCCFCRFAGSRETSEYTVKSYRCNNPKSDRYGRKFDEFHQKACWVFEEKKKRC